MSDDENKLAKKEAKALKKEAHLRAKAEEAALHGKHHKAEKLEVFNASTQD
jgi:hypothetical protein